MIRSTENDSRILTDVVRRILGMKGGPGIRVSNTPNGITISAEPDTPIQTNTPGARIWVIVKRNGGADGDESTYASWTYDLYAVGDTGYTNKLNTSGALQPTCGRCRSLMSEVTQADDGSVGSAYRDASGNIQLFDCPEFYVQADCADEESGANDFGTF